MIIYCATKERFIEDALDRDIESILQSAYRERCGVTVGPAEFRSWKSSLVEVARVLRDPAIPGTVGIGVEYKIPQTNKRVDVIVTGLDDQKSAKAIVVELKQWSKAQRTDKDGIVVAHRGGRGLATEGPHPSYQAWSYAMLLEGFNEAVYGGGISLRPCAYLHNYLSDGEIDHAFYAPHIARAPLFLAGEQERIRLREFIKRHVRFGDSAELLYRIEHGRIRPSKMLADAVVGMLRGRAEFALIDDQKVVFETALSCIEAAGTGPKQVVIVRGGPGSGKSVVAINLLATATGREKNARYVSKNAAPRTVYEIRLVGSLRRTQISNLFCGSGAFTTTEADTFDALIVDEAHRLNEKSGLYGNLGENQLKELITAAKCAVFFVDDDQRVTLRDIGHASAIRDWAHRLGAVVTELELNSQFRCNGNEGYLAWLDGVLGIRTTANDRLDPGGFDFRVFDSPVELHDAIRERNLGTNRSRVVAGYCWEWQSKRNPAAFDVELSEFDYRKRWNVTRTGDAWIIASDSVEEVGCIHTCQGLELDYVGVIIGPDLALEHGAVTTYPRRRARSDKSLAGMRARERLDARGAAEDAGRIIRNTYRTLLTRGMRGCYVYCTDRALADHLRSRVGRPLAVPAAVSQVGEEAVPFRRVEKPKTAEVNAVPLVDLRFAAGAFSAQQSLDSSSTAWVELPEWVRLQPGLFVAQVVGQSMNRIIPDGSWCLFRANPTGTRNGKVVVAQHRSIEDPELGGQFTVKRYSSEKVATPDGAWRHGRVTLAPMSDLSTFQPIVLEPAEEDAVRIVAEFLAVLE